MIEETIAMGKRTGIDFSKHKVHVTRHEGFLMYYIKKPTTICDSIKYINTGGIMAVTGDYGNWIFCREFHPNAKEGVSDGYWEEKLEISSTQKAEEYDQEHTQSDIEAMLNGGLEEYGYTGSKLEEMKEYFNECLTRVDDELEYTSYAYRNYPSFCDHETVIFRKRTKYWLKAVFDGFDEICRRMKEGLLNPSS
jgi:hypothetical protein